MLQGALILLLFERATLLILYGVCGHKMHNIVVILDLDTKVGNWEVNYLAMHLTST